MNPENLKRELMREFKIPEDRPLSEEEKEKIESALFEALQITHPGRRRRIVGIMFDWLTREK